jgi:hypothetical protein
MLVPGSHLATLPNGFQVRFPVSYALGHLIIQYAVYRV